MAGLVAAIHVFLRRKVNQDVDAWQRRQVYAVCASLTAGRACRQLTFQSTYIVAPSTQGANSAPPKSKLSLLVGWPDAVLSMRSKMRWPHSCTVSSPSRMVPQLTSMSSSMRLYMGVLVASLIEGAGLQPNTLPRPVVKQTRLAPPATCPVAATGS